MIFLVIWICILIFLRVLLVDRGWFEQACSFGRPWWIWIWITLICKSFLFTSIIKCIFRGHWLLRLIKQRERKRNWNAYVQIKRLLAAWATLKLATAADPAMCMISFASTSIEILHRSSLQGCYCYCCMSSNGHMVQWFYGLSFSLIWLTWLMKWHNMILQLQWVK